MLSSTVVIRESVQLVHQPFRMDPTQRMAADGELAGIIAQQHGIAQKAVCMGTAPLSPFGGDLDRGLDDRGTGFFGRGDAKLLQMRLPRSLIGETGHACLSQTGERARK